MRRGGATGPNGTGYGVCDLCPACVQAFIDSADLVGKGDDRAQLIVDLPKHGKVPHLGGVVPDFEGLRGLRSKGGIADGRFPLPDHV